VTPIKPAGARHDAPVSTRDTGHALVLVGEPRDLRPSADAQTSGTATAVAHGAVIGDDKRPTGIGGSCRIR